MSTVAPPKTAPKNYEGALQELESIVGAMERGELPLQKAFEQYQRGVELLQYCQAQLQAIEEQVKIFENGQLKNWTKE